MKKQRTHPWLLGVSVALWMLVIYLGRFYHVVDAFPDRTIYIVHVSLIACLVLAVLLLCGQFAVTRRMDRSVWFLMLLSAALVLLPFAPLATGIVILYALPAALAWSIMGLWSNRELTQAPANHECLRDGMLLLILGTAVYGCIGLYFTNSIGDHSGDEGHYLIQAYSLFHDGDLDLRNNMPTISDDLTSQDHINPNSREGKWYSWHPAGLSLVLAPAVPLGLTFRHLILGLISGLGMAGVYWLSREIGSRRRSSWLISLLMGGSIFWGVYSSRALPEILGATLTVYGMIMVFIQSRRPWFSLLITTLCVSFLPWVHTRFIPVALVIIGSYGLHGLMGSEARKTKLVRLGIFTLACGAMLTLYQLKQLSMYHQGMAYPVPKLLFSYIPGLWHALCSDRGIILTFPLYGCGLAAGLRLLFSRSHWRLGLYALLLFAGVWLSSCSTIWFTGGACLPGRFLLVTVPVLMACLAKVYDEANSAFKALTLFVGIYSVVLFIIQLSVLPSLGKSFTNPYVIDLVFPLIATIPNFFYDPYQGVALYSALALYIGAATLVSWRTMPSSVQSVVLLLMLVVFVFNAKISTERESVPSGGPVATARTLEHLDYRGNVLWVRGDRANSVPLLRYSNRFAMKSSNEMLRVTTTILPVVATNQIISYPLVEVNDWDQRPYRWATLIPPFPPGRGERVLSIDAELQGSTPVEFVIKQGSTLLDTRMYNGGTTIRDIFTFRTQNEGDLYILMRFLDADQRSEFIVQQIGYSAFRNDLFTKGNIHTDLY